ncbi:MAG: ATP-binding protein [Syntrophales bacterium]|nr:ATP-binding protein [Syntrophales bacterium]MDD5643498.1 ATP-binding protein [Syntrophales bacterium]
MQPRFLPLREFFMEDKKYRYLWWRITLTNIFFSIIPLFILAAALYYHFSISYTAKVMEGLKTLAVNRQGALDLFLEERISQLATLANTNTLAQLSDEDYLNKVFNIIQSRSRSYIDLGVIDQNGEHLAYVGPYYGILKGVNYRNQKWFDATLNSGIYISDIFLGFRKVPHFIIAVLVREKNRSWILRATIDSDIIESIVRAAQTGKTGDAYLINQEDLLQTKPRFGGNLLERPPGPDFAATVGARIEEISYKGEPGLYAAIQIKIKKWVLVIKENPAEPLAPLVRAKDLVVLLSLLGLALIIIGSVYTTKKMVGRLILSDREKAKSDEVMVHESKMAALGKLAAGVAHEINNPLAVIAEEAGWMKDLLKEEDVAESANFHEFDESLKKIGYHVERVKKVTHRLLGFARRMEPTVEKVVTNEVLEECVGFLENEARYRNITIKKKLAPDLPTISSDSSQLQQVFLNILNNAIDAVGKDGAITLETLHRPAEQQIVINITDTGPGIPKATLEKIFDPFYTTKEVGKGTGLGLSISYSIMEKLGGTITVDSEMGRGTTFTILLPVK